MSVFIPVPKKGNAKESSNYCTIALISHTSRVMLKIFQARLTTKLTGILSDTIFIVLHDFGALSCSKQKSHKTSFQTSQIKAEVVQQMKFD